MLEYLLNNNKKYLCDFTNLSSSVKNIVIGIFNSVKGFKHNVNSFSSYIVVGILKFSTL